MKYEGLVLDLFMAWGKKCGIWMGECWRCVLQQTHVAGLPVMFAQKLGQRIYFSSIFFWEILRVQILRGSASSTTSGWLSKGKQQVTSGSLMKGTLFEVPLKSHQVMFESLIKQDIAFFDGTMPGPRAATCGRGWFEIQRCPGNQCNQDINSELRSLSVAKGGQRFQMASD